MGQKVRRQLSIQNRKKLPDERNIFYSNGTGILLTDVKNGEEKEKTAK